MHRTHIKARQPWWRIDWRELWEYRELRYAETLGKARTLNQIESLVTCLILKDITPAGHLGAHPAPRFIYLDTRPYQLLKNVVSDFLERLPETVLTIHDCSPSLCKRRMSLDRDCREISSTTGGRERYVLVEIFNVPDPRLLLAALSAGVRSLATGFPRGLPAPCAAR